MAVLFKKPQQEQLDSFFNKDILNAAQFKLEDIETVMNTAGHYEQLLFEKKVIKDMEGKVMAALFFEPSTRTRLSFETAMLRLGGAVITVAESETNQISSSAKGETIYDAISVIDGYADVIVIRNPVTGTADLAAQAALHPVINGGDGAGQHPTQGLLDIYTIMKAKGRVEGLTIALVGDLKYGRTVHSLVEFFALYGCELILASPEALKMPAEIVRSLRDRGIKITETHSLKEVVAQADVLYVTRVQKERFASVAEYEEVKDLFIVDQELLRVAKEDMIILHPLPRVNEIALEVDSYPGALYFQQAHNGLFVRMAILALITGSVT
ncbi:MAG: aspartate carbamoyltransferase [Dehalobacterium sp.]|jgi:aspartate carbamoyltransferase catalytic subunit